LKHGSKFDARDLGRLFVLDHKKSTVGLTYTVAAIKAVCGSVSSYILCFKGCINRVQFDTVRGTRQEVLKCDAPLGIRQSNILVCYSEDVAKSGYVVDGRMTTLTY
jgi:hypothetical protein